MKQMILWILIIFVFVMGGCAANKEITEHIQQKSVEQGNVFKEAAAEAPMPGYSMLIIRATMKTVREGFYPLEVKSALHGKPEYPFVFNIGGQGVVWMAKGMPDAQPEFADGKRNPEGGEGVRYFLEKKIMLKPGAYNVYVGLTEPQFQKGITVVLKEGKASILEFRPLYFAGRYNRNTGTFYKGLRDFDVFFDGRKLSQI